MSRAHACVPRYAVGGVKRAAELKQCMYQVQGDTLLGPVTFIQGSNDPVVELSVYTIRLDRATNQSRLSRIASTSGYDASLEVCHSGFQSGQVGPKCTEEIVRPVVTAYTLNESHARIKWEHPWPRDRDLLSGYDIRTCPLAITTVNARTLGECSSSPYTVESGMAFCVITR